MNKNITKLLAVIAGICLIAGLLATVVCACAADKDYYAKEYARLGVAEDIGISAEDLNEATSVLLDYTAGQREDMEVYGVVQGESREIFNDVEKAHMIDVRALFLNAIKLARILLAAAIAILVALFLFSKEKKAIFRGYMLANYIFLAVFACVAIFAALDFTTFWISFHKLFFTNDLWLLDPMTSIMINMYPEKFFFDLVFRIVAWFVGTGAVLYVVSAILGRKKEVKADVSD